MAGSSDIEEAESPCRTALEDIAAAQGLDRILVSCHQRWLRTYPNAAASPFLAVEIPTSKEVVMNTHIRLEQQSRTRMRWGELAALSVLVVAMGVVGAQPA